MQGDQQTAHTGLSHRPASFNRPVAHGLLACAVVSTARWLGAGWVGESWLGLPVGIWVVGAVIGGTILWERRRQAEGEGSLPALSDLAGRAHAGVRKLFSHPIYSTGAPEGEVRAETPHRTFAIRANSTAPLRIGVGGPEEIVEAFVEQTREEEGLEARYEPLSSPVRDSEECARRSLAGAVAFSATGQTAIVLPEVRGREAAWDDWSHRLALSYPGVFPARVDASRIACGPVRVATPRETRLVARMAEAAALLAQTESRTGVRRSPEWSAEHRRRVERAMKSLARTFIADWTNDDADRGVVPPACRATARGLGAWLSTWDGEIDPQERRQWMSLCAAFLDDEPEAHLRLAAAQIGAYEDDQAFPALSRAFELLRASGELPLSDPLAFVLAEMEVGDFTSLALGRVAAGLAIAWATTPKESLAYLRDDLVDDLRHSGKLVGRDQDHAFIKRVMAHMDRLRADTLPMRVRSAA